MTIDRFSKKQGQILKFGFDDRYDTLICDGAVRSGKTAAMSIAFVIWAMDKFNKVNFGICGKTVQSAERNVLRPLMSVEGLPYQMRYKASSKVLTIQCGRRENYFYIFGGKDESSYMLIQGITLAGVLFDEVALMPRSFVEQAISRTLTYEKAKIWYNCNPESPSHWFYVENIDKVPPRTRHLHFYMSDNPAMTPEKIAKAEAKFSGVFYRRYILGEWVRAEGAIYTQFADNTEMFLADECSENLLLVTVGIDYGASRSKTVFKASGFTNGFKTVYALAERDITGVKDPETIYKEFERFYRGIVAKYHKCQYVFADYGALGQVLTNGLQRYCCSHNIPCQISDCSKGRIFDRIELTTQLMAQGRLKILRQNKNLIKAFQEAVWDEKHEDERLDDGTSDIDSLDAFEYSIFPYYNNLI